MALIGKEQDMEMTGDSAVPILLKLGNAEGVSSLPPSTHLGTPQNNTQDGDTTLQKVFGDIQLFDEPLLGDLQGADQILQALLIPSEKYGTLRRNANGSPNGQKRMGVLPTVLPPQDVPVVNKAVKIKWLHFYLLVLSSERNPMGPC
ncbi:uncharacterized protein MELLADRAFT_58901 [Melampsora larici-populina 98AG31]|uniref:Uncharacterized protein n=1 Tax=Melampsora larici-populina (strain 98AG31 / pathotype 3-4-7) TaxID=747676 RepID=F4R6C2_MELLP|nr:uncharacterized protein MELLADRAFT_58901 [Melampsora larici-populina 98AG31]EGG12487.1 hypothetical protein MELLADRAFT_58901 [Melampsora larici-populina 98AG31]